VVRESNLGAYRFKGFPGTSNWEETPGKTQDTLKELYLPAGLGTPRDPPEGAGKCWGWEGSLGQPAGPAAPSTWPQIKLMRMDGWKTKLYIALYYSFNDHVIPLKSDKLSYWVITQPHRKIWLWIRWLLFAQLESPLQYWDGVIPPTSKKVMLPTCEIRATPTRFWLAS